MVLCASASRVLSSVIKRQGGREGSGEEESNSQMVIKVFPSPGEEEGAHVDGVGKAGDWMVEGEDARVDWIGATGARVVEREVRAVAACVFEGERALVDELGGVGV